VSYAEPFIATRWSLLSRLRNLDDQASWQDFFNTYWKLIYGVALKAGLNDAEAQDVVQETVLTVVR
jgi:RNA polymerase sigma-70 factor (ECF subfamily)